MLDAVAEIHEPPLPEPANVESSAVDMPLVQSIGRHTNLSKYWIAKIGQQQTSRAHAGCKCAKQGELTERQEQRIWKLSYKAIKEAKISLVTRERP